VTESLSTVTDSLSTVTDSLSTVCLLLSVLRVLRVQCSVCCSVLQCVAVCCSVLQCVAVCCSVLQCAIRQSQTTKSAFMCSACSKSAQACFEFATRHSNIQYVVKSAKTHLSISKHSEHCKHTEQLNNQICIHLPSALRVLRVL